MVVKTEGNDPGEFLAEYYSDRYNFEEVDVDVPTGANMDVTEEEVLGMPIKDNAGTWEFLRSTDEANADGVLITGPGTDGSKAAAMTFGPYKALVRGPAVIVQDLIQANDGSGVAFDTVAEIVTALEALNIVSRSQVAVTETQTT